MNITYNEACFYLLCGFIAALFGPEITEKQGWGRRSFVMIASLAAWMIATMLYTVVREVANAR